MTALSKLITKVTKLQFSRARTIEEVSTVLDRTIAFAEKEYISDAEVEDIAATIPIVDPVTEDAEGLDGEGE